MLDAKDAVMSERNHFKGGIAVVREERVEQMGMQCSFTGGEEWRNVVARSIWFQVQLSVCHRHLEK